MSKGEEKQKRGFYKANRGRVLPSMPKGETVGNVVIDGKGIGKGGASETVTRKREKQSSRVQRQSRRKRPSNRISEFSCKWLHLYIMMKDCF